MPNHSREFINCADFFQQHHPELRCMAGQRFRKEKAGHTLQPTALVNEAFLRLQAGAPSPAPRKRFFAMASNAMRQILIEYARQRNATKRGGRYERVPFEFIDASPGESRIFSPSRWQSTASPYTTLVSLAWPSFASWMVFPRARPRAYYAEGRARCDAIACRPADTCGDSYRKLGRKCESNACVWNPSCGIASRNSSPTTGRQWSLPPMTAS